jgi:hypothetical protein
MPSFKCHQITLRLIQYQKFKIIIMGHYQFLKARD